MSTFRPPVGPIQPARFFTPGASPPPPISRSDPQSAPLMARGEDRAALVYEIEPFVVPPPAASFVPARALQIPSSPAADLTAQLEELAPFFTAGLPLGVPLPQPAAHLVAGAVYFRVPIVESTILEEVLPSFTPGAALGRPGAPILQLPIASVRSELAALEEVLPPFLVPIAPSSFVPFSGTPNVAAYVQRDRASEIAAIDESLPRFTPSTALGRPGAPILQLPIAGVRGELAALEEVLPPFLVPTAPASFVYALRLHNVMQPRARDDLAALEEVLPPFAILPPPVFRPSPAPIALSLYVRREDPAPLMQPRPRSLPLPPAFFQIDPETTLEAPYQSRLLLAPYARAIDRAPYVGKLVAAYDPGLIVVSYDGRKLT